MESDVMSIPEMVTVLTGIVALTTIAAFLIRFGAKQQKVLSDVEYLRRDMDQVLKYFRLTPAETQDRRGRH